MVTLDFKKKIKKKSETAVFPINKHQSNNEQHH